MYGAVSRDVCLEMEKSFIIKKLMDFDTIGGKSNKNGARFDLEAMHVNWLGLSLKCYLPKSENSLS